MWRVRRKNERGFNDGFHLNNGEGARQLVELLNKQDSELTAARELVKNLEITVLSLMMENKTITEQRDKLAEAGKDLLKNLYNINDDGGKIATIRRMKEALQSLTTKDHE
jgi:hypothetical protein